jgi:hypothetical protein
MSIPLDTIYSYFETGDFPTQEEFKESWSSFWHKDEAIPMSKIIGLSNQFQYKVDKTAFDSHVLSSEAHVTYLAKNDASNLNPENIQSWKNVLGVKQLLNNLATFDDGSNIGNVYTKNQSDSKYMFLQDFLNNDKKILAEKIEALGLTTLIEATEKSIVEFAERSDLYKFEDNDFIAVPDGKGNFSLYLYKGGDKMVKSNYLSTGLSNITMGMVEGLQGELNKIQIIQDGLIDLNTNLQTKADKVTVLEQINTLDAGILIKADKSAVLEQFNTLNTNLETKVDLETAQVEFNKIKLIEGGVASLNLNLQAKADKATVQEEFIKIKFVEDGVASLNLNLQTKADKAIVLEQINALDAGILVKADKAEVLEQFNVFNSDLETKVDLETAQAEFTKIKLVENGVASLSANLETKVDVETAQLEFNKIKLVENGVASLNLNLQTKADKSTIQEQFNVFNSDLETKVDLETAQAEFTKIKLVENGIASLSANIQTKVDVETAQVEFNKIKLVENGVATVKSNLEIKADKNTLENHVWSSDSHVSYLTRRDASNLDDKNINEWQKALGISGQAQPTRNYKIYRALLNVDEESFEPKFIVLENTIGDINWKRDDVGFYTGRIEKDFPKGRVWINSKVNISFKKSPPIDCMVIMDEHQVINLNILARNNDYVPIDLRGEFGIIEMYVYDIEK